MFIGHYSAALAAKAAEPRARLWTYVAACQLIDIGWGVLVLAGVERMRIDPTLPGNQFVLEHMPYTHSLPAAVLWSLAALLLSRWLLKLPWRAAVFVGLAVASHWLLDLLVHRPDLELWFGGTKAGLAFWNHPLAEMALELGLVAIAGAAWVAGRKGKGRTAWPAVSFIAVLVAVAIVGPLLPMDGPPAKAAVMALATYLTLTLVAWLVDRGPRAQSA